MWQPRVQLSSSEQEAVTSEFPTLAEAIPYHTMLYSTLLHYTLLYSALLHSTLLYHTTLYSTVLHSTTPIYSTLLHHMTLCCVTSCSERHGGASKTSVLRGSPGWRAAAQRTALEQPTHLNMRGQGGSKREYTYACVCIYIDMYIYWLYVHVYLCF